jgi:hypothetical protein
MDLSLPFNTVICLLVIGAAFLGSLIYIIVLRVKDQILSSRRIVEYLPSLVSTLGVLGTFYGITTGLMSFDTSDLDQSIPGLLDGLKTAFYTSLAGMIGSVILSCIINRIQDKKEKGVSDINQAASAICNSVQEMSTANRDTLNSLRTMFEAQEADRRAFYRSLGDAMDTIATSQQSVVSTLEEVKECQQDAVLAMNSLVLLSRSQDGALTNMREGVNNSLSAINRIEEATAAQLNSLNNIANSTAILQENSQNISELLDAVSGISTVENDINAEVHRFKDILDGEVTQIEESMTQTNQLLTEKFDEFTELLKKSNTEALVEVMKHVTEEFQKQMNALISKLIQENFEKLNTSVEQLNTWQQENKKMIASLTTQYKEMADNFEATSASLTQVKDDTTSLVSEGGKLRQIVDALNKVIVEDERFLEVTKSLQETANLSKDNMEKFDKSTNALNDWVRKQRHFVEGVQALIKKLEDLDKIRDYNEQFWSSTKKTMEQGVSIISNGTQELNKQLKSIDQQFYSRLSATLAELDNCISTMVDSVNNRR